MFFSTTMGTTVLDRVYILTNFDSLDPIDRNKNSRLRRGIKLLIYFRILSQALFRTKQVFLNFRAMVVSTEINKDFYLFFISVFSTIFFQIYYYKKEHSV